MRDQSESSLIQEAVSPAHATLLSAHTIGAWWLASFHAARDGMVVTDAARQIVLLNREAERMFGYATRRLIGKPVDVLFSILAQADYWRQIDTGLAAGATAGEVRVELELQGVRADGEEFPINASVSVLAAQENRLLAFVLREAAPAVAAKPALLTLTTLRRLGASALQVNEVERRRFSRELYDDLGQNLSVLKLDLDWLQNGFPHDGPQFDARVAQMQTVLDGIIVRTKSIASALRPPLLDDFGLVAALKWASERFQKKTSIRCSLQSGEFPARLGDPAESAIYRVVQEGLLNIERHAHASQVSIALWHTEGSLHVLLRDNGIGMSAHCKNKPGCFGLMAMQQRIYAINGQITIENIQPSGVEIHATIPIEPDACGEVTP